MPDNEEEIQHLQGLLKEYKKRLHILEVQAAKYGMSVPPYIIVEVEESREQIKRLKELLKGYEVYIEDF